MPTDAFALFDGCFLSKALPTTEAAKLRITVVTTRRQTGTRQYGSDVCKSTWSNLMTTYLDIDELAELLGLQRDTVRKKLRNAPWALPPAMHIPRSKMLRWRAHEVKGWLSEHKMPVA